MQQCQNLKTNNVCNVNFCGKSNFTRELINSLSKNKCVNTLETDFINNLLHFYKPNISFPLFMLFNKSEYIFVIQSYNGKHLKVKLPLRYLVSKWESQRLYIL